MARRTVWRRDIALYGAIGGLTAAQAMVASGEIPKWLNPWIGIPLAVLVAIKAKLSNGKPAPAPDPEPGKENPEKPGTP